MSEITTKLPYVAGYNIKMAFVIQDLKNLDEMYGETSRHSLMGNCGYQLVFGANDQVTAEAISKGLGKRTVRYKTESRTIELMGLHRRTKVEQLRERDLMMPQEVRQMPGEKMIILAEGQGPIFADKLRFFRTAPFKAMEGFSRMNVPYVPATEFIPQHVVPAIALGASSDGSELRTNMGGPQPDTPAKNRGLDGINRTKDVHTESLPVASTSHDRPSDSHPDRDASAAKARPLAPQTDRHCSKPVTSEMRLLGTLPRSSNALAGQPPGLAKKAVDGRFEVAARRLKTLAARDRNGNDRPRRTWSAIFDETVADDALALELN
jgi:type IV secretion system protein VirD4